MLITVIMSMNAVDMQKTAILAALRVRPRNRFLICINRNLNPVAIQFAESCTSSVLKAIKRELN